MIRFLLIFIGGGLGSVVRFALARCVQFSTGTFFPWGTLVVNIVSCFVLGFTLGLFNQKILSNADTRLFIGVGFCGGFSTFSTFSLETVELIKTGEMFYALLYIALSIIACLAFILLGMVSTKLLNFN